MRGRIRRAARRALLSRVARLLSRHDRGRNHPGDAAVYGSCEIGRGIDRISQGRFNCYRAIGNGDGGSLRSRFGVPRQLGSAIFGPGYGQIECGCSRLLHARPDGWRCVLYGDQSVNRDRSVDSLEDPGWPYLGIVLAGTYNWRRSAAREGSCQASSSSGRQPPNVAMRCVATRRAVSKTQQSVRTARPIACEPRSAKRKAYAMKHRATTRI